MTKNLLNRNYKVFVDFDGTITKQDVGEQMFLKFGDAEEAQNIIEKWFKNEIRNFNEQIYFNCNKYKNQGLPLLRYHEE